MGLGDPRCVTRLAWPPWIIVNAAVSEEAVPSGWDNPTEKTPAGTEPAGMVAISSVDETSVTSESGYFVPSMATGSPSSAT